MRKILIAIAAFVALATIASTAEAMPKGSIHTIYKISAGRKHVRNVYTSAVFHWRWQWRDGTTRYSDKAWANATNVVVRANVEGDSELCGPLDIYNGTTFQVFLSNPVTGYHWKSRPKLLTCSQTTVKSRTIDLRGAHSMHFAHGVNPVWRVHVHVHLDFGTPDGYDNINGQFRRH